MMDDAQEHNTVVDLMPDYALGNLSADERSLVEGHVGRCPPCREELNQYQETAAWLPQGMALYEPPSDLKKRILQTAVARRPPVFERAEQRDVTAAPRVQAEHQGASLHSASARSHRRSISTGAPWWKPAWNYASLALIAVLSVSTVLLWQQLDHSRNSSTLRTIELQSTGLAPGATGTMVISLDGEHGTVVVDAMPVLDEFHEYQVWLDKGGAYDSGGIFGVSDDGYHAEWIHAPQALASYDTAIVTIEPVGGSAAPTGQPVLSGDI